jgi:hypothetical protein
LNKLLVQRRALLSLSLLQAIHRRQSIRGRAEIALTFDVWEAAGNPSRRLRATLMAHLRRLEPDLVVIREDRTSDFRYRIKKGPVWLAIEEAGRKAGSSKGTIDLVGVTLIRRQGKQGVSRNGV